MKVIRLFSLNMFQTPVSLSTLHVIHLLKKECKSFSRRKKKIPPPVFWCFILLSFSLSNSFLSFQRRRQRRGQACAHSNAHKGALMLRWEDWKLSLAATLAPGPGWLVQGQNRKHCRKKKKGEHERRDSRREKLLGCYSLIRSPFLWWSHLLREGERRSAAQTLKHDPPSIITIENFDFTSETAESLTEPRQSKHSHDQKNSCTMQNKPNRTALRSISPLWNW